MGDDTLVNTFAGKIKKGGTYYKVINLKRTQEIDVRVNSKYFWPFSSGVCGASFAAAYNKIFFTEKVQFLFYSLSADI